LRSSISLTVCLAKYFKAPTASTGFITMAPFILFIGATGKSAQIPLYTWLPDAMAARHRCLHWIHAATMVTAGIYMIAQSCIV
jgi:NADH-quinone oxidoreductase subunit L